MPGQRCSYASLLLTALLSSTASAEPSAFCTSFQAVRDAGNAHFETIRGREISEPIFEPALALSGSSSCMMSSMEGTDSYACTWDGLSDEAEAKAVAEALDQEILSCVPSARRRDGGLIVLDDDMIVTVMAAGTAVTVSIVRQAGAFRALR